MNEPIASSQQSSEGPGTVIGRYKLLQHIGDGGFGSVYMAEQTEPVVRKVALKIIKLGMDTKQVIARFEAERQALALMEHPNIAKVLDGGVSESGRPYFVMELVRGISITEYCDQNNLSPRERLELFIEVCQAVQHAHQKGVIHRDIKPSNVLVTVHDGKPVPKVIDFGIAKAMHGRLTEKTLFTEFRQFIGTPAYMSPEQAEMSGLDIDTRTDIYSLGVLLYELLTGSTPFDTRVLLEAGYGEIQRLIRENEPPKPSVRISSQGSVEIARHRRLEVQALSRMLRGDLDWIAMRALEKDRSRRYATASELAEDVRRHLHNEPVQAGPPGAAYRVKKFLSRNRAAVGWGMTLALLLVLGIVGTTWGLLAASRERDVAVQNRALAEQRLLEVQRASQEATAERTRAHQAAAQARNVTDFLTETLALSNPMISGSAGLSTREVLDRASEQVERLGDQPYAEASVRATIGRAYRSLGEPRLAEPHLRRAAELMHDLPDFDGVERYETLWALTITLYGLAPNEAKETALEARRVGQDQVRKLHPELAALLERFLQTIDQMDVEAAADLFEKARVRAAAELRRGDRLWHIWIGLLQAATHSYCYTPLERRAESFMEEVFAVQGRELGPTNPETAESLAMLAGILNRSGRAAEAETRIRESVRVMGSVFKTDNPLAAFAEEMLGENLMSQGRFEEAEPILLKAHEVLLSSQYGSDSGAVDSLRRMAALYNAWGKPDQAAPYRSELVRRCALSHVLMPYPVLRQLFVADAAALRTALDRLQQMQQERDRKDPVDVGESLAPLLEGARLWDPADPRTALLGRMLVQWCSALEGRVLDRDRERMCAAALDLLGAWRERVPPVELADALALHARFTLAGGDREHAVALAREAWELVRERHEGEQRVRDAWDVALVKLRIGSGLLTCGLGAEAEELLLSAHATLLAQLGPKHQHTHAARAALHSLYTSVGRPSEAATYADTESR